MSQPRKAFRTIELGDGIVEVTFLRGRSEFGDGWWCTRRGVNFDYADVSFYEGKDQPRWAFQLSRVPSSKNAAAAIHLTFCDATGEGLSCAEATAENVTIKDRFGKDGITYVVIAKRTRTERVQVESSCAALH